MRKRDIINCNWDKLEGFGENRKFIATKINNEVDATIMVEVWHYKTYKNMYGRWQEWRIFECGLSCEKSEIFDYINFEVKGVKKYVKKENNEYEEIV